MRGNRKWSAGQEKEGGKKREMSETKANFPGVLRGNRGRGKENSGATKEPCAWLQHKQASFRQCPLWADNNNTNEGGEGVKEDKKKKEEEKK